MAKHTNADILQDIKKFIFNVCIFLVCCYWTGFITVMYDKVYTPTDTHTNIIVTGLIISEYYCCYKIYKELCEKYKEIDKKWKEHNEKKHARPVRTTKTSTR